MQELILGIIRFYLILGLIIGVGFYYYNATIHDCTTNAIFYGIVPSAFLDGSTSFMCLLLIVYKLRQLLKQTKKKNRRNVSDLKYLISKLCILTVVAICSTGIGALIYYFILPLISFAGIDMMINSLCLMLSFAHYDLFYKRLCFCCRKCCEYK